MVRQQPLEVTDSLRAQFREFMRQRPDLSADHFAQYTTLAPTTIRRFMAGTIPGGSEVVAQIRNALSQAQCGDILTPGRPGSLTLTEDPARRVKKVTRRGTFYETQTVRRVFETLEFCAENAAIGVITGDFGVGKTVAVKEWQRRNAGKVENVAFEFDEFTAANKIEAISMVARAFAMQAANGSTDGGRVFRAVCDRLRQEPCLLIFDQCEAVRPRVCQVIRQIWDRTNDAGVGVVILAQQIMLARMVNGRTIDLGALTSRVGVFSPLTGLTRSEMAAIIKQEGIGDVDDSAFDLWYRALGGSIRRLMKSMDLLKAKHAGKRVTEKTVAGVAGHLWGMTLGGNA